MSDGMAIPPVRPVAISIHNVKEPGAQDAPPTWNIWGTNRKGQVVFRSGIYRYDCSIFAAAYGVKAGSRPRSAWVAPIETTHFVITGAALFARHPGDPITAPKNGSPGRFRAG
jgi:hypothetical protein